jgi:Rod binding domain-containing protein
MPTSVAGIFAHTVFSGGAAKQTNQKAAAAGFAQIFTTMLAKQMRQSMVGEENGPMGIGGGSSGDIYGSMLDQALGKTLAKSKSMAGLTKMINRQLSGPRHPIASAFKDSLIKVAAFEPSRPASGRIASGIGTVLRHASQFETEGGSRSDSRGPLLLPPAPDAAVAPLLQPPSPLEG